MFTEWIFLPTSALGGPWGSVSVSSVSWLWGVALSFDFMGISETGIPTISPESQRLESQWWSRKPGCPWKQFWRISPWCEVPAHSVACQRFWLQVVNHKLWTSYAYFSFPSPTYWSSATELFFLCLWGKSVWRKWQHGLTDKKQKNPTDLRLEGLARLHHSQAVWPQGWLLSEPWSCKMEPIILVLQGCFCWED